MKCSYYCETLQDQIKCQEMLFAKGAYWNAGQKIQYTNSRSPMMYHLREYDNHLSYSNGYIDFKEAKVQYPSCIYFRANTLMETE